jgi:hypothetical protein
MFQWFLIQNENPYILVANRKAGASDEDETEGTNSISESNNSRANTGINPPNTTTNSRQTIRNSY